MAFTSYTLSIAEAVRLTKIAAQNTRAVQTAKGDLTFRAIASIFDSLERAQAGWRAAVEDVQAAADMAAVNAYLASIGGPTAGVLQSRLADIEAAKVGFGNALRTFLHNQSASLLVDVVSETDLNGNTIRSLRFGSHVSDPQAQTMRDSAAIANLVAAFDALGV